MGRLGKIVNHAVHCYWRISRRNHNQCTLLSAGAVKTIVTMLGTEPKRAAAMTMLGKTVERHSDQVRKAPCWISHPPLTSSGLQSQPLLQ